MSVTLRSLVFAIQANVHLVLSPFYGRPLSDKSSDTKAPIRFGVCAPSLPVERRQRSPRPPPKAGGDELS
jgi:hypothetical protein